MEDSINALLRIEGANSCPGEGWDQVVNAGDYWVRELPAYSDLKQSVFDALSSLDSGNSRVILHLGLFSEDLTRPLLIDHELLAFLGSRGIDVELFTD